MQKLSIKQKLGLILFGVFLCLVILEIVLRLGGFIILSFQEHKNRLALQEKGTYRIMCLGGSTTAEGGEYAYPVQLEEMLNEKNTGVKFKIINKGVQGADSTFILSQLQENLDKYNPDLVIVMMGENDWVDLLPYNDSWGLKVRLFFRDFRIYKTIRLLIARVVNKNLELKSGKFEKQVRSSIPEGAGAVDGPIDKGKNVGWENKEVEYLVSKFLRYMNQKENIELADKAIRQAIEISPQDVQLLCFLGDSYACQGRYREAEAVLKKGIALEPNQSFLYVTLAFSHSEQRQYLAAEDDLKKAIELDPRNYRAYSDLIDCYKKQGKDKQIQGLCESIISSGLKDDVLYGLIAGYYLGQGKQKEADQYFREVNKIRLQYYNSATRSNYQKLKKRVAQKGIKLVCVQHPMRSVEPLRKLFDSTEGMIFVDNEKTFKQAVKKGKYEDYFYDRFGGDFGHATPKGNRLLAENICQVILREVFNR
jgi:tetratricopeptide (TPR) repeat protein